MLAHQGGWDEILLVIGPIVVIVLVLWRATVRVGRGNEARRKSVSTDVGSDASEASH